MPPIDDALEAYLASLDTANDQFLNDVSDLEEDGLSATEILAFIAAIDIAAYFIEDLGMSAGINAYMAATEDILAALPFFGATTETQLVALQNIQRTVIDNLTRNVASSEQTSIAQGSGNGLDRIEIADLMSITVKGNRADSVITTMLSTYEQSVIASMTSDLPANTRWEYVGPRDEKNRPVCRQYLDAGNLTKKQIRAIKGDGFEFRGGWRCRHQWYPVT